MVLTSLLLKCFHDNLSTVKYPNNVISVRKGDSVNIKEINFPSSVRGVKLNRSSIDLSNLERLSKHIIKKYHFFLFI